VKSRSSYLFVAMAGVCLGAGITWLVGVHLLDAGLGPRIPRLEAAAALPSPEANTRPSAKTSGVNSPQWARKSPE